MPVFDPGAGGAGTASDRLAMQIRRMTGGADVLGASAVIVFIDDDGTETEVRPEDVPAGPGGA